MGRVMVVGFMMAAVVAAGWAGVGRIMPRAPWASRVPATLPALPTLPPRFEGVSLETHLELSGIRQDQRDELLSSHVLGDPEFTRAVHWWIDYWRGGASEWFPGFLSRMAWLGDSVDEALASRGFPPSLRYLPLIESGYDPRVTSRARAVGMWQLMPETARWLGLEVTPLLDERRNPEKSTEAALRYLDALHAEFDSWYLTLAAYNSGPARVRRILRRYAPDEPRTDSLFWALRDRFPRETRDFLPKLYGAMWVASYPEAYGYEAPSVEPYAFDLVRVPDHTSFDVLAWAAGVSHAEIVRLNPEYVREATPPSRSVLVRVPKGGARMFGMNYPRIPPEARAAFVEHVVQSGETLSEIAALYGVRMGEIEAMNPRVRKRSLQIGARLTVPLAPRAPLPRPGEVDDQMR